MEKIEVPFKPKHDYKSRNPLRANLRLHTVVLLVAIGLGISIRGQVLDVVHTYYPQFDFEYSAYDWGYEFELRRSPLGLTEGGTVHEEYADEYQKIYAITRNEEEDRVVFTTGDWVENNPLRDFQVGPDRSYAWMIERVLIEDAVLPGVDIVLRSQSSSGIAHAYRDFEGDGVFDLVVHDVYASSPTKYVRMNGEGVLVDEVDGKFIIHGSSHVYSDGAWVPDEF